MHLSELVDMVQGGFWTKERNQQKGGVIIIVGQRSFPQATLDHPHIQTMARPPSPNRQFDNVAAVIFVRPYDSSRMATFREAVEGRVKVIDWGKPYEIIEYTVFEILARHAPWGEKKVPFPKPIEVPAAPTLSPMQRRGKAYGMDFVLLHADPMAPNLEADIARIHGLIPDGPGKPGIPTLRKRGKLGLYTLRSITA